ncbi:pimeloyl-ACP methyl ester esterase BioH [Vibrio scophthalmi]|uniref:pimeloyl-ACP methyl ester esterase BioH n=1 Tax=Vibrio scophthalmi TaxID=45658 RepID=UPI002FF1D8E1
MKKVRDIETTNEGLFWQSFGDPRGQSLVLVHGWGMNGAVWQQTATALSTHYHVHVVDLPGFGHSSQHDFTDMAHLAQQVLVDAPAHAVWLGWSLGGLLATHIALHHPDRVSKLITVASSPKFEAGERTLAHSEASQTPSQAPSRSLWRGIAPKVLSQFSQQLADDFALTIERFMALQAMGSPSARQDIKTLKHAVLSRPAPNPDALMTGLTLLADCDYRHQLAAISQPTLRLYGRLDGLVPAKVAKDVSALMPHSTSHLFTASSHAPFITEFDHFCQIIKEWVE